MEVFEALLYLFLAYTVYKILDYLYRLPRIWNLQSRYILITGCDTGFGNAAAKKLDSIGCHVIAGCLTESGETELRKACSNKLKTISLDVASHDSVLKAYEQVKSFLPHGKGEKQSYIYQFSHSFDQEWAK